MISQTRIWLSAFLGMLLITTSIVAQADVSSTIHSTSSSVISMTTSKKLGEEIRLSIKAKGPISIDGVIETPQQTGSITTILLRVRLSLFEETSQNLLAKITD